MTQANKTLDSLIAGTEGAATWCGEWHLSLDLTNGKQRAKKSLPG